MMHGFGFGGFGGFGGIGMILNWVITIGIIIGIVLLIVWLIRKLAPGGFGKSGLISQPPVDTSPREILKVRYASGELTREQYKEILADLA